MSQTEESRSRAQEGLGKCQLESSLVSSRSSSLKPRALLSDLWEPGAGPPVEERKRPSESRVLALALGFGLVTVSPCDCPRCGVSDKPLGLSEFFLWKLGMTNTNLVVSLWLGDAWHMLRAFVKFHFLP